MIDLVEWRRDVSRWGLLRSFYIRAMNLLKPRFTMFVVNVREQHRDLRSYTWRSFTTAPHVDGLWVAFERPVRYGYKAFTHPDYRGRHLQDLVSYHTDALSLDRGFRDALSIIEAHNFASIASDKRRGNRIVGWAGYIKAFGPVFPFRSPGARRYTFRFVKDHFPMREQSQ